MYNYYKFALFAFSILSIFFSTIYINQFRIDASSDTLVAQNDKDFRIFNNYQKDFPTKNNLVVAIKSQEEINLKLLNEIELISNKISKIQKVESVFSINKAPILFLNDTSLISELEGFSSGDWWVQDYSSQIPVTLLNIRKDDEVLDLCAAPGGKTAQLISLGANVTSVDGNKNRIIRLKENLTRLKFSSKIFHSDVRDFNPSQKWSKIILDAPCSSTGTLRRHPDIMHIKGESDIHSLAKLQSQLLLSTWKFLTNGGSLIYCTCSLEKEEGENQIFKFINENKDAKIDKIKPKEVTELKELITKEGLLRIFPSHLSGIGGTDGFFIARLKKVS